MVVRTITTITTTATAAIKTRRIHERNLLITTTINPKSTTRATVTSLPNQLTKRRRDIKNHKPSILHNF